jgi:hypothetical protein
MSEEEEGSSQVLTYVSHLFVSSHFPVAVDKTGGQLVQLFKVPTLCIAAVVVISRSARLFLL